MTKENGRTETIARSRAKASPRPVTSGRRRRRRLLCINLDGRPKALFHCSTTNSKSPEHGFWGGRFHAPGEIPSLSVRRQRPLQIVQPAPARPQGRCSSWPQMLHGDDIPWCLLPLIRPSAPRWRRQGIIVDLLGVSSCNGQRSTTHSHSRGATSSRSRVVRFVK